MNTTLLCQGKTMIRRLLYKVMEAATKEATVVKWLGYLSEEIEKFRKIKDPTNADLSQLESEIEMRLFSKGVNYPDGTGDMILGYLNSGK